VNRFRILATGAIVATAAAVVAGSALAGGAAKKPVPFRANFSGKAVVRVSGEHADIVSARAAGSGVPIGKATLAGKGAANNADPCPLFGGPATITAKAGKLKFTVGPTAGKACTNEEGQLFTLSGRASIKGGTGKYARAKGSFRFAGTFNRKSGAFSVRFLGTMTL
jgi:hypothetical protein